MPELTNAERAAFIRLLDMLDDHLGNAGCNDFTLPDTPENRAIVSAIDGDDDGFFVGGGELWTYDFSVLDHIRRRLGLEGE